MPQTDLEKKIINIIKNEKTQWEEAQVFITEKIAFHMRNLIKQFRKNYYGIFDTPTDSVTGREKTWVPLTESTVEAVVKNIDLDTKDINFRAKTTKGIGVTGIVRNIFKNFLDSIFFGEYLDKLERQLAIDGTHVWKTIETKKDGKWTPDIKEVDLLNCYIDPSADSIQEAYRFTERALMTIDELKSIKGLDNIDDIKGVEGLHPTISKLNSTTTNKGHKYLDVWEMWGKAPKWVISGNDDDEEDIEVHIIASGLENPGNERVHLVETNKKKIKPYEEAWYSKVPGRWYGRGVAEKLLMLQTWVNILINIRINRSFVSQLGIFKVRKGAGITQQSISRMAANGVISVQNMEDIEQFVMQEASQSSYSDEANIKDWTERLTSAFEVVTGEQMPATTSATATAIQNRNAQSQFVLIKEGIGMFLQRWIKRHSLKIVMKNINRGDVIRYTDEPEALKEFDERLVDELLHREIDKMERKGQKVLLEDVLRERDKAVQSFRTMGEDRYVEIKKSIDYSDLYSQVYVTNEEIDKGVLVQNLISALQLAPEHKEQILQKIFDTLGIGPLKTTEANQLLQQQPQQPQQPQVNPQQQVTNANLINA